MRALVTMLPANFEDDMTYEDSSDDLNRACANLENCMGDTAILLAQISDNGTFFESKKMYGTDMVTAFIKLNGTTVGAVANRSESYDAEELLYSNVSLLSARGAREQLSS